MRKGQKHSPESCARMSASHTGVPLSHDHLTKLRESRQSADYRCKQSLSAREAWKDPEVRKRGSECQIGRVVSPETVKKIAEANLGKKRSQVFCDKARSLKLGSHHSPESRAKMSESRMRAIAEGRVDPTKCGYGKGGHHFSPKLGMEVVFRSSLEHEFYHVLDVCRDVVSYKVEPIRIPFTDSDGIDRHYVPDLIVRYATGREVLVEIKPEGDYFRRDQYTLIKMGVGMEWAGIRGMDFEMWGYNELEVMSGSVG